ncbi:hypothetical protein [Amphibacillus indicireducens]|uniref:Uncharacterized protein n=1 Tax=Amphibacillus indicireducens TaxID=1076330 RepID=A0ABP7VW73_9BACI
MGFIVFVVVVLFGATTLPIGGVLAEHVSEFWAFVGALGINLFLSTALVLLYYIHDYLKQIAEKKID